MSSSALLSKTQEHVNGGTMTIYEFEDGSVTRVWTKDRSSLHDMELREEDEHE